MKTVRTTPDACGGHIQRSGIPVITIIPEGETGVRFHALRLGVEDAVSRRVSIEELVARAEVILRRSDVRSPHAAPPSRRVMANQWLLVNLDAMGVLVNG